VDASIHYCLSVTVRLADGVPQEGTDGKIQFFCSPNCAAAGWDLPSDEEGFLVQAPMLDAAKYIENGEPRGVVGLFRAPGVAIMEELCSDDAVIEYATQFVRGYIEQDGPPIKLQEAVDIHHCGTALDADKLYLLAFTMEPKQLDIGCLSNAQHAGSQYALMNSSLLTRSPKHGFW
jgi:hypothetical protein